MPTDDHTAADAAVDIVATIPVVMGFHPTRSIVVVEPRGDETYTPAGPLHSLLMFRVDLVEADGNPVLALALAHQARKQRLDRVCIVVIDDTVADCGRPPHGELIDAVRAELSRHQVRIQLLLWASSTRPGAVLRSYDEPDYHATLPDTPSPLAVASVVAGEVTFDSREQLVDELTSRDPDAVRRRSELLDQLTGLSDSRTPEELFQLVLQAIRAPEEIVTDRQFADLAIALSDYRVRDRFLAVAAAQDSPRPEQFWITLTRELPAPERAEPATILAAVAYMRGNGALVNVALDVAFTALPTHNLASLFQQAFGHGVSRQFLLERLQEAAEEARLDCQP